MSPREDPADQPPSGTREGAPSAEQHPEERERIRRAAEHGAESYGGDPDTGPSVHEKEVESVMEREAES